MMKTKPITPYQRLLDDVKGFCRKVKYRHSKSMFLYPKDKLRLNWTLTDLYERTAAAEQLGYDVVLIAADEGLKVQYKKKVPDTPYSWE